MLAYIYRLNYLQFMLFHNWVIYEIQCKIIYIWWEDILINIVYKYHTQRMVVENYVRIFINIELFIFWVKSEIIYDMKCYLLWYNLFFIYLLIKYDLILIKFSDNHIEMVFHTRTFSVKEFKLKNHPTFIVSLSDDTNRCF